MKETAALPVAGRLLLAAAAIGLGACGGNTAGPDAPNPLGVPDTIVFAFSSAEVVIGDTVRLSVVARDAGGNVVPNVVLIWRSLTPSVATVSADGLVTALDIGEAEIEVEATVPGSSMALSVDSSLIGTTSLRRAKTRFKMYSVPKLAISPGAATVIEKDQQLFTASVTNLNDQQLANRPLVKWTSSNPAVATIDAAGLATALTKGTTTIRASVTVGSSQVSRTATLTVDDALCGGIGLAQTLKGILNYDYTAAGTLTNTGRVASVYSGEITAEMTNLGWSPGDPTVVWKGPLGGKATQIETVHDGQNKETRRLDGAGPVINVEATGAHSNMTVIVELKDCTFRMETQVSITLTSYADGIKGLTLPMQSARLYGGAGRKLNTTGGNPFPVLAFMEFPGHSVVWPVSHPTEDVFAPQGWAAALIREFPNGPVGKADVSWLITKP